ncbi:MAG: hypothetical protein DIZ80_03805 [endosymbiont of Galathealinum brachiosum]|uniref:PilZ domain-containing protein n=1 Tax=endosymbiont of Galathealinum brachiosum TaxID=2200906 RepID=A0A370DID2_9GAMM|nr:MAG: hypothetical protein DIZ80_03805 [endosymbiont of Galathealinum brachiosum]
MSKSVERRTQCRVSNIDNADETKKSLIINISAGGAGLLISKSIEGVSGKVCMKILHPELSRLEEFDIDAGVVWIDEEESADFRKIGVQFTGMDEESQKNVSHAIDWLGLKDHHFLRCEITEY